MAAILQTTLSDYFSLMNCISTEMSLKSIPKGSIDDESSLVQIMTWHWTGSKPLPKPMLTQFCDTCVSGLQRVKGFLIIAQFMMSANIGIPFCLQIVFVCLYITPSHYHQCANLSEDTELIKCLSDIFCEFVSNSVRLSMLSQLSIIQYMGLCVFSLPITLVMIQRIYALSYYHHQSKYELLSIASGQVMKQWYTYVSQYS